jgi:hypothetical protein
MKQQDLQGQLPPAQSRHFSFRGAFGGFISSGYEISKCRYLERTNIIPEMVNLTLLPVGTANALSLLCQASGLAFVFKRTSFFNPEGIGSWNRDGERNVDIVSGCFSDGCCGIHFMVSRVLHVW